MGNLSPIDQPVRIPIVIPTPEVLMDHHFQGQPVYPAVQAMETLARCTRENYPQQRIDRIADARFDKFLPMDPGTDTLGAFAEFQQLEGGAILATLLTRTKAPKAAFTRTKTHVRMTFLPSGNSPDSPPTDIAAALEGVCTVVDPGAIYRELVPFGPAFRNIAAPLHISPDGALARIETPPANHDDASLLLGSGYALDAAFHAACVWAQRYRGVIAFPVAIDRRYLLHPADPSRTYSARVFPKKASGDTFIFDILLFDQDGNLSEMDQGVHMRDVSGGRLKPPSWLCAQEGYEPLDALGLDGNAFSIVELDAVAGFSRRALSPREDKRYQNMGDKRRRSFLAARLALKRLCRKCCTEAVTTAADQIDTVYRDSPKPRLDCSEPSRHLYCSVSHDRRFAIAVAGPTPVGVDVEVISPKALNSDRIFMSEAEQALVRQSPMDDALAALRIWSIKEAAAKAASINLAEAWRRVQVGAVGESESALSIDGNRRTAHHAALNGHLFSLIVL